MLLKVRNDFLIICLLSATTLADVCAEPPTNRRCVPYPAAGWRPAVAFDLPGSRPVEVELQPQPVSVEVSKERIDFAGQLLGDDSGLLTGNAPQQAYLPAQPDYLNTQGLPNANQPSLFNRRRLPARPILRPIQPQLVNRRPQFVPPQATLSPRQPAQEYGPPPTVKPTTDFTINYPDPRALDLPENNDANTTDDADTDSNAERTPIEALNAAIDDFYSAQQPQNNETEQADERSRIEALNAALDAYYKAQAGRNPQNEQVSVNQVSSGGEPTTQQQYSNLSQGRYYILTPENTLQRVVYTTQQKRDDARSNDFTAQLQYSTVGEVQDPIYKYNAQGQLVRVVKK